MSKEQYDEIAEEYSQMMNPTKIHILIPTFKKIIGDVQGKSVLDLACGAGFFTRILADLNPSKLIGIDFSKELIKKAIEVLEKMAGEGRISVDTVTKVKPDMNLILNLFTSLIQNRKEKEKMLKEKLETLKTRYKVSEISIEEYESKKQNIQEEIEKLWS